MNAKKIAKWSDEKLLRKLENRSQKFYGIMVPLVEGLGELLRLSQVSSLMRAEALRRGLKLSDAASSWGFPQGVSEGAAAWAKTKEEEIDAEYATEEEIEAEEEARRKAEQETNAILFVGQLRLAYNVLNLGEVRLPPGDADKDVTAMEAGLTQPVLVRVLELGDDARYVHYQQYSMSDLLHYALSGELREGMPWTTAAPLETVLHETKPYTRERLDRVLLGWIGTNHDPFVRRIQMAVEAYEKSPIPGAEQAPGSGEA